MVSVNYNESQISFLYKLYGMIFVLLKGSNFSKIALLNGMFENEDDMEKDLKTELLFDSVLEQPLLNQNEYYTNQTNENKKSKRKKCSCSCSCINEPRPFYYKCIICIILAAMQLTYFIYITIKDKISIIPLSNAFTFRLVVLPKIFAYNIIDFFCHPKRIWKTLKEKGQKASLILLFIFYFAAIIAFIVHSCNPYSFSTIKSVNYFENNSKWFKTNSYQTYLPESYCYIHSPTNGYLKTDDLSMLTTLPRLYSFNKNGNCFIKPSMRGLFNSTMKYIFGKNYEEDEIEIYCKKMSHYPILVITSKKMLNQTLLFFEDDKNITFLDVKNTTIKNND